MIDAQVGSGPLQQLVGLSGLAAGDYLVWVSVQVYDPSHDGVSCYLYENGSNNGFGVDSTIMDGGSDFTTGSFTADAENAPANTTLLVECFAGGSDAPVAYGSISALKVGSIQ